MTQRSFNIYVFTQGQIKEGPHGTDYDGGPPVLVRVNKGISFAELERKLFVALRLDRHHVMTITYRCPIEFVSTHIQYRRLPVIDDDTVDLITDMLEQHVELSGADLYVEVERCRFQEADEVPSDTLPSLAAMVVNPNLPHVIIVDILSRLPVKSLCRFKCVSKQWHSLIPDPKFVKMHLEKAVENKDIFHERRRLVFSIEFNSLYFVDLDAFVDKIDEDVAEATELDYLFNGLPSKTVYFFISCNGLLLCQLELYGWELYLINPSTRELKKVPEPPYHEEVYCHENYLDEGHHHIDAIYGFGFDHTNNDFKVVRGRLYDCGIGFSVYSLRTDSWRVIQGRYFYTLCNTFPGIVLNGGLHWLVSRDSSDSNESYAIIMCFDVVDEKVREVQVPAEVIDPFSYILGVVGECLCIKPYDGQKHSHFWVMKEYGVIESWTKVVITIPFELLDDSRFSKDNEDLLKIEDRLVMYNLEEGTYWDLEIRGVPKLNLNRVETYLESLVSPNYHHGLCGEYQAQG